MNSKIISGLETLIQTLRVELDDTGNKLILIKIRTYMKVIMIIQKIEYTITEGNQLKDEKGIGPSTIKHINNILSNNNTIVDDSVIEIKNLQKITGIGPVKAKKLYDAGFTLQKILDDFKKGTLTYGITHHQMLGIKHFHDLEKRIPYDEITEMEVYLNDLIKMLKLNIKIIICGSYRRKTVDSGDIDILIYNPSVKSNEDIEKDRYLPKLLAFLNKVGFLKDHLTSLESPTKYMGMCSIKHYFIRRIDIRFVPMECIYSAMLYFTGSGEFNLNMRAFAKKKGYTINEYGIYKLVNGKKGDKVDIQSEEDIFKILDLEYVEPHNRIPNYIFK